MEAPGNRDRTNRAQSSSRALKMIARLSIPAARKFPMTCSIKGTPSTGTSGLAIAQPSSRRRLPSPAARIPPARILLPLTGTSPRARPGCESPRPRGSKAAARPGFRLPATRDASRRLGRRPCPARENHPRRPTPPPRPRSPPAPREKSRDRACGSRSSPSPLRRREYGRVPLPGRLRGGSRRNSTRRRACTGRRAAREVRRCKQGSCGSLRRSALQRGRAETRRRFRGLSRRHGRVFRPSQPATEFPEQLRRARRPPRRRLDQIARAKHLPPLLATAGRTVPAREARGHRAFRRSRREVPSYFGFCILDSGFERGSRQLLGDERRSLRRPGRSPAKRVRQQVDSAGQDPDQFTSAPRKAVGRALGRGKPEQDEDRDPHAFGAAGPGGYPQEHGVQRHRKSLDREGGPPTLGTRQQAQQDIGLEQSAAPTKEVPANRSEVAAAMVGVESPDA